MNVDGCFGTDVDGMLGMDVDGMLGMGMDEVRWCVDRDGGDLCVLNIMW